MRVLLWFICFILLGACKRTVDHYGKTPLVQVAGEFLYLEDLRQSLPMGMTTTDSTQFAEQFIRNWIEETLLYQKANRNVANSEELRQHIEQYRRALIIHSYQQQLIAQQLEEAITPKDMVKFYEEHQALFLVDTPLIKGLFIKIPIGQAGINNVRNWYRVNNTDNVDNLEKFSLKGAVEYLYFYDHWIDVTEMIDRIPFTMNNPIAYLKNNRQVEIQDNQFVYFLNIEEYLDCNEVKPFSYASKEIKEVLLNMKQVEYMRQVKDDLYQKAIRKDEIDYYYKD